MRRSTRDAAFLAGGATLGMAVAVATVALGKRLAFKREQAARDAATRAANLEGVQVAGCPACTATRFRVMLQA